MSCISDHWGLEFSREDIDQCRKKNGLLSLELELSRRCNLRCIYCYAASGEPMAEELSLVEIKDVIVQAARLGARKIIVLGGGEPLLYPDLFFVIDTIREHGLEVDLFTNATLIRDKEAKALYDWQVSVAMKMNSRDPAVQDLLAGRAGAFQDIENGRRALQSAGYPDETHTLGIETIICRQNYEELPDLWRWARSRNIIPYVEIMTMQGRAADHPNLEVSPQEVKSLFETLARIDRQEFGRSWTPHPPLAASQCARHEYSCTMTANGEVHPCPGVSVAAGNIRTQPLADILSQSRVIQDLRNIRTTIKGSCASCEFGAYCYGCRGHAFQVTGDYLAEDPLCWLKER